jgi:sortase A
MNRNLIVPGIIMAIGGLCMLGGVGLLIFRLADPETAANLIPGTPSPIPPTQASLFETPLPPPPRIEVDIPIMPVMEVAGLDFPVTPATDIPTPSDTDTPTLLPSATPSRTLSPTPTSSPTQSIETLVANQMATAGTPLPPTLTPSDTATPIPFVTPTPSPTLTPSPTRPARNPARLVIPAINLDAEINPVSLQRVEIDRQIYSQWGVPDGSVVGWHDSSAPLGQPGNTVFNGHHNVNGHVFRDLVNVEVGEAIRVEGADGSGLNYTVVQTMILLEEGRPLEERLENARWLLPSHDERITLVTCWPPNGRTHRLVVVALPSDQVETSN